MYDVIALGELLIDFAAKETDADGYPTMKARRHFSEKSGMMRSESSS